MKLVIDRSIEQALQGSNSATMRLKALKQRAGKGEAMPPAWFKPSGRDRNGEIQIQAYIACNCTTPSWTARAPTAATPCWCFRRSKTNTSPSR